MKTIVAIGGEEVGVLDADGNNKHVICQSFHEEILQRTGKKHPTVLYIPTAKNDREDYIAGFENFYMKLGCAKVETLRLINERPSSHTIKQKILAADAIYVNGGNSFRMLRIWQRYGVDVLLKKAWQQGTVMSGHSAGALCWFSYACSDAFYKHKPFRATAMGWINAVLCPHYNSEPVRQIALKHIMKRTPKLVAIGLDEHAAIEIIDSNYRILAAAPTDVARKLYWQHGTYKEHGLPVTIDFQDLVTILQKPR